MTHDPNDPLVDRLRRGLDEFTASVRREPPDAGVTTPRPPIPTSAVAVVVAIVGSPPPRPRPS